MPFWTMGVVMLPWLTAKTTFCFLVREKVSGRSFSRETPVFSWPRHDDQVRGPAVLSSFFLSSGLTSAVTSEGLFASCLSSGAGARWQADSRQSDNGNATRRDSLMIVGSRWVQGGGRPVGQGGVGRCQAVPSVYARRAPGEGAGLQSSDAGEPGA